MSRRHEEGYERDADQREHPAAVRWWYVTRIGDRGLFARGGRVRSARQAREAIRQAAIEAGRERSLVEQMRRPKVSLGADGELLPIERPGLRSGAHG